MAPEPGDVNRARGLPVLAIVSGSILLALTAVFWLDGKWAGASGLDLADPASGAFAGATLILFGLRTFWGGRRTREGRVLGVLGWACLCVATMTYLSYVFGPAFR